MSERKEMSTETRSLLAAVLCLLVIAAWSLIYKPPQPPPTKPPAAQPRIAAAPAPGVPATAVAVGKAAAAPVAPVTMRAAGEERSIVIESDLYRVEISNRGGVVRSWQLKKFTDDHNAAAHARSGPSPMPRSSPAAGRFPSRSTIPQQESAVNNALFEITSAGKAPAAGTVLHAPAEITLAWSDGHLEVTKHLKFNDSYIVDVQTSATLGREARCEPASPGPADSATPPRTAPPLQTQVFTSAAGKLNTLAAKNLGKPGQTTVRATVPGTFDFVGIEDLYFAAAFLPPFTAHGDLARNSAHADGLDLPAHHNRRRRQDRNRKSFRKWPRALPRRGRWISACTLARRASTV